jgi:cation:H+ antiporter
MPVDGLGGLMDILVLAVAFVVILVGSELFTNGVEWLGHKLELGEGAIGSVLAAVGTALPETMIPFIAIVFGGGIQGGEVGIGAILGAPFMLATLAMFVTGTAAWSMRGRRATGEVLNVAPSVLSHDMSYFAVAYAIAVGAALLPVELEWPRRAIAVALLAIYARHVWGHLSAEAAEHEGLEPLRFHRLDRRAPQHPEPPRLPIVTVQVAFALACIIGGAWGFVQAIEDMASSLGVNGTLLALVIAPIATELPEKLNSVIWVSRGKDTLALGNVTGAMVFQSAFPTSVGLIFAPALWSVAGAGVAFFSAIITFASSAAVILPMVLRGRLTARALMIGGVFYLSYLCLVVFSISRPGG